MEERLTKMTREKERGGGGEGEERRFSDEGMSEER